MMWWVVMRWVVMWCVAGGGCWGRQALRSTYEKRQCDTTSGSPFADGVLGSTSVLVAPPGAPPGAPAEEEALVKSLRSMEDSERHFSLCWGVVKWSCGGVVVEWRHGGVVVWWNGGAVKRWPSASLQPAHIESRAADPSSRTPYHVPSTTYLSEWFERV